MDANSMEYVKIGLLVIIATLAFANLNTLKSILEKLNDNNRPIENTAVTNVQNLNNAEVATTVNESRVTEEDLNDEEKLVAIMAAMIDASEDNSGAVVKVKSIRRIA